MSNKEENEAIIQWLDGELSDEDLKDILSQEDVLAYKQIINEVDNWVPDIEEEVFDVILMIQAIKKEETKVRKLNVKTYMSIAASVIFLIAAGALMLNYFNSTTHIADNGKSLNIVLPDGFSKVTLSPGSSISWTKEDWSDDKRNMIIEGKAFFDVAKGAAFTVNNENGKVEVLGTQFEVNGFEDSFIVACYEGKVRATTIDQKKIILTAGEESHAVAGTWNDKRSTNGDSPTWFLQFIKFDNSPLKEVIAKLEKTYDIKILTDKINLEQKFKGMIPTNDLDVALAAVFEVFNIKYELVEKTLYLTNE